MVDDLSAESAQSPPAPWELMLKRGFRKKCPRCGAGHLYQGWFRMRERCPGCGFKFEREPGFFVGAYLVNFAVAEGLLFIVAMAYIAVLDRNAGASVVPPLLIGIALAVLGPLVFYPFARTIWSAIDLGMTPLELHEIIEARDHLAELSGEPLGEQGSSPRAQPDRNTSPEV